MTSTENHDFVRVLLTQIPVLVLDSACIRTSVEIYQRLKASNQLIPLPDIFIAATAITHNLPLLTLNQKHFARIIQLKLYQEGD
ncbi:MAG: type II toxin-antitoxin system VapC family toxin [Chloroflexi bacterium]|nr:type II toxin-antitoxin system VapC family toxin [Chloroflexota bacterium]